MGQLSTLRNLNAACNGTITAEALNTALAARGADFTALMSNSFELNKLMASMTGLDRVGQSTNASTALLASTKAQTALSGTSTFATTAIARLLQYSQFSTSAFANTSFNSTLATSSPTSVTNSRAATASALTSSQWNTWIPRIPQRQLSISSIATNYGRLATSNPSNDDVYFMPTTGFSQRSTNAAETFVSTSTIGLVNGATPKTSSLDGSFNHLSCSNGTTAFFLHSTTVNGTSYISSTTDFTTFTSLPLLPGTLNGVYNWQAIASSATTLLVVGKNYGNSRVVGAVSTDSGQTWGSVFDINTSNLAISGAGFFNNEFIVVANNVFMSSANGSTGWTSNNFHASGSSYSRGVVWSGARYVLLIWDATLGRDDIYTSTNKTSWASANTIGSLNFSIGSIATNGAGVVVFTVQYNQGGTNYGYVRRSTDHGLTWAQVNSSAAGDYWFGAVAFSTATGGFIGLRGGSVNGSSTTGFTISSTGTFANIRGYVGLGNRWVSVVHSGTAYFIKHDDSTIRLRSTDGLNFEGTNVLNMVTTPQTSTSTYVTCMRWCNNQLLAGVSTSTSGGVPNNYIARSSNGAWWSFSTANSVGDLNVASGATASRIADFIYATINGVAYYFALTTYYVPATAARSQLHTTTDLVTWSTLGSSVIHNSGAASDPAYHCGYLEFMPATSTYPEAVVRVASSGSASSWSMTCYQARFWTSSLQITSTSVGSSYTDGGVGNFQISGSTLWAGGFAHATAANRWMRSTDGGQTWSATSDYALGLNNPVAFRNIIPNQNSIISANNSAAIIYNGVATSNPNINSNLYVGNTNGAWVELSGNRHMNFYSNQCGRYF